MYELHQHCFKPRMDTYKNLKNQNWLLNLKQPLKESYPATLPPTKRKHDYCHRFHRQCWKGPYKNTNIGNVPWLGSEFMVNFQKPIDNTCSGGYSFWFIQTKQYQIKSVIVTVKLKAEPMISTDLIFLLNKFWPLSETSFLSTHIHHDSCNIFLGGSH